MQNAHAPFIRDFPESENAILLIHGILGTPRFFDFLMDLIPPDWTVHNILLDGHGHDVQAFSRTSMENWMRQVVQEITLLSNQHKRVFICGHSMGTLLAIKAAHMLPDCVQAMLLLAVPLRISLNVRSSLRSIAVALNLAAPAEQASRDMIRAYSITPDRRIWRYLGWIPRYLELFRLIRDVRRLIPSIHVKCTALQSGRDEMVSLRAADDLKRCPQLTLLTLPHSGHYAYAPGDESVVKAELARLLP